MECSVVIPAFNEAARIPDTLQRIDRYFHKRRWRYEIIVVDDGSTDETVRTVERFGRAVRIERLPQNRGKGAAVRRGFSVARYPWVLFSDADLSTPIEDMERFVPDLPNADLLIGSRALAQSRIEVHQPLAKELLGRAGNLLIQAVLLPGIVDSRCGFKIFRRDRCAPVFACQRLWRWGFDDELLFLARKAGLRIVEVPVRWRNDTRSKVRWNDYLRTPLELLRIRWNDLLGNYPLWPENQSSNEKTSS